MSHKPEDSSQAIRPEVIVMGAGAAGFSAALSLAERGYNVKLIEQNTLGSGTSGRNPGRMGHGFHYVDVETAKTYLRASIQVQRKYPNYLVGKDLPEDNPLRHGRYFITKNSDYPPEEILATYEEIKKEYQRLIAEDPANQVFGPPDKFFRVLEPHEYENDVNMSNIARGVETAEHLFNWQDFAADIKRKILDNPNITLYENTEIVDIERGELDEPRFTLHAIKREENSVESKETFHTDFLVNSTWQNIEKLNDKLGLRMIPGSRTNRLKCLLVVKLPESLRDVNSMFFCMGQHGMFSNLGNGYGMMTYAKVTNMGTFHGLDMDENTKRLLDGQATASEKEKIAREMLEGITNYIPAMAEAEIVDVKFGIVQTEGKLTLEDLIKLDSSFHKRDYHGVREEQIGLISNPCVKLFYFVKNGELVANLVDAQVDATAKIKQYMQEITEDAKRNLRPFSKEVIKAIHANLERHSSSSLETALNTGKVSTEVTKTTEKKKYVSQEIKEQLILKNAEGESTEITHQSPQTGLK